MPSNFPKGKLLIFFSSLLLAIATAIVMSKQVQLPYEMALMGGIFVLAAILWVTQAIPLFATSLLVIGLQAVLFANSGKWGWLNFEVKTNPSLSAVFAPLSNTVLVLFFGGFVLANAAAKTGVDRALSGMLIRPFGKQPKWSLMGIMLMTMIFSMWMSNTATTAMMLAIIAPTLLTLPPGEPFRKALVLAVPMAANLGGMGTPIGSPPNAVAVAYLKTHNYNISFLEWMLATVPMMLVLTLMGWFVLCLLFPPSKKEMRLEFSDYTLTRQGYFVIVIFFVTVGLWMTDTFHGLHSSVVALLPVVALAVTGVFNRDDLRKIDWSVLILIAGGLSLGTGMAITGLDAQIGTWLPGTGDKFILFVLILLTTFGLSTFMSNTAAANLFVPIAGAATIAVTAADSATTVGALHPIQAVVGVALVASLSMALPISTPPNAMAFSTGEFENRDMIKSLLVIGLIGIVAVIFGGGLMMRMTGLIP